MEYSSDYYNNKYDRKVKKILKTYNSILVKCRNIPISPDKNIILVDDMDSMINTQIETRKPILYIKELYSTSFMILDQEEVYVYIIKRYDDVECIVENIIKTIESSKNSFFGDILGDRQLLLDSDIYNQESKSLVPLRKKNILDYILEFFFDKDEENKKRRAQRQGIFD